MMKFWPFKTEDRAQDGYTNQRESEIVGQAYGNAQTDAAQVAVVEFGLNLYGRAFAAARVKPSIAALSPELLSGIARRLLLKRQCRLWDSGRPTRQPCAQDGGNMGHNGRRES